MNYINNALALTLFTLTISYSISASERQTKPTGHLHFGRQFPGKPGLYFAIVKLMAQAPEKSNQPAKPDKLFTDVDNITQGILDLPLLPT
jgi:hypothetical protein